MREKRGRDAGFVWWQEPGRIKCGMVTGCGRTKGEKQDFQGGGNWEKYIARVTLHRNGTKRRKSGTPAERGGD